MGEDQFYIFLFMLQWGKTSLVTTNQFDKNVIVYVRYICRKSRKKIQDLSKRCFLLHSVTAVG